MWTLVVDRGVSFISALDSLKAAHGSNHTTNEAVVRKGDDTNNGDNPSTNAGKSPPADAGDCSSVVNNANKPWNTKEGNFGFWKVALLLTGFKPSTYVYI